MCGIVGIYHHQNSPAIEQRWLEQMLSLIRHRGPDEFGIYRDAQVGLGSARLSVIDLETGTQPISNEDGTIWIVFNGEIFNYVELRPELEERGHRFSTATDTEVILHLYEEYGAHCVELLNGQFAFAIWDRRPGQGDGTLLLARDRVGICPLFYTRIKDGLIFGSEIKALLGHPALRLRLDLISLAQVFTLWTTLTPRTIFEDVLEVPPGHTLQVQDGQLTLTAYWTPSFPVADTDPTLSDETYIKQLRALLIDATRIRLRADVPVGAYLSGGLDSSSVAAIVHRYSDNYLRTFSIAFADPNFDEREHQLAMAKELGTDHAMFQCTEADIGRAFPDVIWHTEWPILRTSPVPMFLLSQHVRQHNMKVVLTGEGADEFLGGYNIYKEAKLRRFWARDPESKLRPLLLQQLYPYVAGLGRQGAFLRAFFQRHLTETDRLDYSHIIRWENTASLRRIFSSAVQAALNDYDPINDANTRLIRHPDFRHWSALAQAQYLEISIFLSEYLLSSQGDRMLMAHSVEGRFPFLDHRVIEFASHVPPRLKIRGMNEKYILKRAMTGLLPDFVIQRTKRPYRAPIQRSFFSADTPDYVETLLAPAAIRDAGYFHPRAVQSLLKKARSEHPLSERDNMALAGVLSTQLIHRLFVENSHPHSIPITLHKVQVGLAAPKERNVHSRPPAPMKV